MTYTDRNGIDIWPGDRIMWTHNGQLRISEVIYDREYKDELRCGGLSISAVFEQADSGVEIVNVDKH